MTDSFAMFKSWAEVLLAEDGIDYTEKGSTVINTMATRYVEALDAGDTRNANKYIAGLMLRFWNNVGKMQMKGVGLNLTYDEYVSWLYEAIEYACKYRAWLNPEKNINAQQAINQCIETIRRQHYYEFNLDKHRANYNSISIDTPLEGDGNSTLGDTIADTLESADHEYLESDLTTRSIIQSYISRKKLVEAIILDVIAFNDVEKVTKKVVSGRDPDGTPRKFTQVYKEFWPYRAVQILSTLPATYPDEFGKKYSYKSAEFDKALEAIKSANNQKLYKYLYSTLADAKASFT